MEAIVQSEIFQNAFLGGAVTAVLCAVVGYFMVLRILAFASEALTDIGFAGATGSALLGINPFLGMLGFAFLTVVSLSLLKNRLKGRDIEVGMVLSFALGLGVLFLSLHARSSASHANFGVHILFGSLLSLPGSMIFLLFAIGIIILAVLAVIFRPLLFASINSTSARAKGVPTRILDFIFLLVLAATTVVSIQSMGVLLAFALLSAPAGTAHKLIRNPAAALGTAILLGLAVTWAGLLLSFFGPWNNIPAGFYITSLSSLSFGAAFLWSKLKKRLRGKVYREYKHNERETND